MSMFDNSRTGEYIDAAIARAKAQFGENGIPEGTPIPDELQITVLLALKMAIASHFPEIILPQHKTLRQHFDKTAQILLPCLMTEKGRALFDHMQDNLIQDLMDVRDGKLPRD